MIIELGKNQKKLQKLRITQTPKYLYRVTTSQQKPNHSNQLFEAATADLFKYFGSLGDSLLELRIVVDGVYKEYLSDLANNALANLSKLERLVLERNFGGYSNYS
jgi:hypothetical protein